MPAAPHDLGVLQRRRRGDGVGDLHDVAPLIQRSPGGAGPCLTHRAHVSDVDVIELGEGRHPTLRGGERCRAPVGCHTRDGLEGGQRLPAGVDHITVRVEFRRDGLLALLAAGDVHRAGHVAPRIGRVVPVRVLAAAFGVEVRGLDPLVLAGHREALGGVARRLAVAHRVHAGLGLRRHPHLERRTSELLAVHGLHATSACRDQFAVVERVRQAGRPREVSDVVGLVGPLWGRHVVALTPRGALVAVDRAVLGPYPRALRGIPQPVPVATARVDGVQELDPLRDREFRLGDPIGVGHAPDPHAGRRGHRLHGGVGVLIDGRPNGREGSFTGRLVLVDVVPEGDDPRIAIARRPHTDGVQRQHVGRSLRPREYLGDAVGQEVRGVEEARCVGGDTNRTPARLGDHLGLTAWHDLGHAAAAVVGRIDVAVWIQGDPDGTSTGSAQNLRLALRSDLGDVPRVPVRRIDVPGGVDGDRLGPRARRPERRCRATGGDLRDRVGPFIGRVNISIRIQRDSQRSRAGGPERGRHPGGGDLGDGAVDVVGRVHIPVRVHRDVDRLLACGPQDRRYSRGGDLGDVVRLEVARVDVPGLVQRDPTRGFSGGSQGRRLAVRADLGDGVRPRVGGVDISEWVHGDAVGALVRPGECRGFAGCGLGRGGCGHTDPHCCRAGRGHQYGPSVTDGVSGHGGRLP